MKQNTNKYKDLHFVGKFPAVLVNSVVQNTKLDDISW